MRLTIERMRWMVLAVGVLLVVAIGVFLALNKWRHAFTLRDLPQRLGMEIQQEANGVTYTQSHGGHTLFKIHASKVVQLKQGNAILHDVHIELYGEDGSRVDRIDGAEFEYDQKAGTARAAGPVEITLMRPGEAPAIAPKATPEQALNKGKASPLSTTAEIVEAGQIHVKTSGLVFDQKSGFASTAERVEFQMAQGRGSATGASYDSGKGVLTLQSSVELATRRGEDTVHLHASHAEFERDTELCRLRSASVDARGSVAQAAEATLLFREDGTVDHLDASGGFTMTSASGGRLTAPRARMDFDLHNQPRHGRLEGGVLIDSRTAMASIERTLHGSSPSADLDFNAEGQLRHAHLERGVEISSVQQAPEAASASRTWRSPVADVDFRSAGEGQLEASTIHGSGGVVVLAETARGQQSSAVTRLSADQVSGDFAPGSVLRTMSGTGSAILEQHTASGALQTASGDRIDARFAGPHTASRASQAAPQIDSARIDGHVLLIQTAAPRANEAASAPLRASAGRADYEGQGGWLHLTLAPRIVDAGLELTATKIDFSQISGEAWAHGNVKASWNSTPSSAKSAAPATLGGQGPVHAVAQEAELRQATGEVTFRGQARLWQQANSISAPLVVLNRLRRTLTAHTADPADPVRATLAGAEAASSAKASKRPPQIVRIRSGELNYSDAERKATLRSGSLPAVTAETGTGTITSATAEILLLPSGNHAAANGGSAQVDRLTARGHVTVASQGRRGSGEQLVYTGENSEYVLTGTAAQPPRITDPVRGVVTGDAIIFDSRDDSVRVEGGLHKTTTQTTAPK